MFLSSGRPVGFESFRKYHPDVQIPNNSDILERIKKESPEVDIIGPAEPVDGERAAADIKKQRDDIHGLIVFGPPPVELLSLGLPTVAVERPLEGCTTIPFSTYKGSKVVTSFLPAHHDKDPVVYTARYTDISRNLNLINAVIRMNGLRVLVVTDKPPLGYFEPVDLQIKHTRKEYEDTYLSHLKGTFGTEFITVPQESLFKKVRNADEVEAKKIATTWIEEALALRWTNEAEVLSSGKLYMAMKELMNEYNCQAITTEGFGWPPLGYKKAVEQGVPSQGLPTSQFCTDGVVAASETLTDCLLTQQLGLFITGSTGFLGDYTIDPFNNTAIVAHCEGTFRPYGDERKSPYILRNLPFVEENTGGACAETQYPVGEVVTVAKISMYQRKLSVFTGVTVSGEEVYSYWADILGRNKAAIKTNVEALFENAAWDVFGNHRTVFFGDYRQEFKDLGKLIGYEVIEKDKK